MLGVPWQKDTQPTQDVTSQSQAMTSELTTTADMITQAHALKLYIPAYHALIQAAEEVGLGQLNHKTKEILQNVNCNKKSILPF